MPEGNVSNPLVWEFSRGNVPRDLRFMGAQGLLSLKPEHLLELWTDLAHDRDPVVGFVAQKSLALFPADEMRRILDGPDPPIPVLWWALVHRPEPEFRRVTLRRTALPQEAIDALAPVVPRALAELAMVNHTRLLRRTSLLLMRRLREAPIGGPAAQSARLKEEPAAASPSDQPQEACHAEDAVRRAASFLERARVEREQTPWAPKHQRLILDAIELLERALQELRGKRRLEAQLLLALALADGPEGARRFEEVLLEASRENPRAPEPFALLSAIYAEVGFRARAHAMRTKALELSRQPELASAGEIRMTEDEAIVWYLSSEERKRTELVSAIRRLCRLSTAARVITALEGTREERAMLVRDPNGLVAAAALSGPCITDSEIAAIARQEGVAAPILRYIGDHSDWPENQEVATALVMNPRTPLATSLALVARLDAEGILSAACAQNLPEEVRERARELTATGAPRRWESTREDRRALLRRVDALIATTMRSVDAPESPTPFHAAENVHRAIEKAAETLKTEGQTQPDHLDELEGLFVLTRDEQMTLLRLAGLAARRAQGGQVSWSSTGAIAHDRRIPGAAVELYEALVRARLRPRTCDGCGASLRSAALIRSTAGLDAAPGDLRLSHQQVALLLAATDDLLVNCGECNAEHEALAGVHGRGSQAAPTLHH